MRWRWVVVIPMMLCAFAFGQEKFPMTCHPFEAIEVEHPIDSSCGITGTGRGGSALQNQTKNNFCAGTSYQAITQQDLLHKQEEVEALPGYSEWSQESMPVSRSDFVSLGEGVAVQFIGYVLEAHYADLTSGESVNCDVKDDEASNDIHIALVPRPGTNDECQSNSAEMVPHYRPASWTVATLKKIGHTTLVRVSGLLMYDADHKICGEQGFYPHDNPSRLSGWEIHPVYAFDVCVKQVSASCAQWQSLSNWLTSASKPRARKTPPVSQDLDERHEYPKPSFKEEEERAMVQSDLKTAVDKASTELKQSVDALTVVEEPFRPASLDPQRHTTQFYYVEQLGSLCDRTRLLLRGFSSDPKASSLVAYIDEAIPTTKQVGQGSKDGKLIPKGLGDRILAGVEHVLERLTAAESNIALDLTVMIQPGVANVELTTATKPPFKIDGTSAAPIRNVYRGLYTIEIEETGFKQILKDYNFLEQGGDTLVCSLVPLSSSESVRFCDLK